MGCVCKDCKEVSTAYNAMANKAESLLEFLRNDEAMVIVKDLLEILVMNKKCSDPEIKLNILEKHKVIEGVKFGDLLELEDFVKITEKFGKLFFKE